MSAEASPMPAESVSRPRLSAPERALIALIAVEVAVFGVLGTNFFTAYNGLEVLRLSVEVGLLALALTPVIVTGGIDLSVGSLMGLSAVVFGGLWRDAGLPVPLAAAATLGMAALAGGLNAGLITRLGLPPLIVTLGTFSLFRGLAEGLTGGVENYTNFPRSFQFLGQGYVLDWIPTQVPLFLAVAAAFALLLHRTTIGRGLYAIGLSAEGSRYAGIPVGRRLALVYTLSGLAGGLAAIVYVAHLGQAKADAGTGYELSAITAVVLGGTSIFGGKGTIAGTLLGLLAIAILQNGLRLSDLPAELAGGLTGGLLLLAIGLDRLASRPRSAGPETPSPLVEEFTVKNSQVAALAGVILAAAAIIAGGNVYLARSLRQEIAGLRSRGGVSPSPSAGADVAPSPLPIPTTTPGREVVVAMMPKSLGNAYFIACRKGAEESAKELGVRLLWDGPKDPDPVGQNEVIDTWITRGVDVIAVAVENKVGISSVLRKARERGIKVVTWDADAEPDARDFFVNQATPEDIGATLMDHAARILGGKGRFAIITASLTASNMIAWQEAIEARRQSEYPDVRMAVIRPCDDLQKKAFDEAHAIMNAYPDVKLIMAICSPAVPGAAEAVKQSGRSDVKVIGLGLPNDNKRYVHEGITEDVVLWNTMDLGYLTVRAAKALKEGALKAGDTTFDGGRLGPREVAGDNILLGKPFTFTKENIDGFDF